MSDEETVFVLPRKTGQGKKKLHLRPDCGGLARADQVPSEKPRSAFPNHEVCEYCLGVAGTGGPEPGQVGMGERFDAVLEALEQADKPLSRRDLEFEAHLSTGVCLRVLQHLRDRGRVETVDSGDGDGRVTYYHLAASDRASTPDTARAQAHPTTIGLLTVVVGVLLVLALGIANGVVLG